jgi:tetratricopeptide (TPR) repeat protein
MLIIAFFLIGELCHTSGMIDIPTATQYDLPGMWGAGLTFSFPFFSDDPYPNDPLRSPDPMDFTMTFHYGFGGKAEISLSMYTPTVYSLSFAYLIKKGSNGAPAFFCGIDDISYNTHLSTIGMSPDKGFIEEKIYDASDHRPWELFSAYIGMQKSFSQYFDFVFGLGRGRFVGYGQRSHIFNTDLFIVGEDYANPDVGVSSWAFGVFFGGAIKAGSMEFIAEIDGRDGNAGVKYHHQLISATLAITKCEHFWNKRPWSPRFTLGLEGNNRPMLEAPKVGSIECVIRDNTSKQFIPNAVVDIKEVNKRYRAKGGTFSISLPASNYTITVSKANYQDYIAKIAVKSGKKTKLVFNLKKTAEALEKEKALLAKQKNIKAYFEKGKIYYSEGNLTEAKKAFDMVLSLDPDHAESKSYLTKLETRRAELIRVYTAEAKSRAQAKDYTKAIEFWQKVLALDTDNAQAKKSITDLQKQIAAVKKPTKPTKPKKPTKATAADIEKLYKKGVTYFTSEKYDQALKAFKQVLALDPNHKGARDYKKRTEARLKILKGGG